MVQRLLTGKTKRLPGNRAVPRNWNVSEEGEDNVEELDGFPTTAKWSALTAREEPVSEPQMVGQLRAPMVPQGEESIPKFDFNEMFDQ